jgi:hypothetical protein
MIDDVGTAERDTSCGVDRLVDVWTSLGSAVTDGTDDPAVTATAARPSAARR